MSAHEKLTPILKYQYDKLKLINPNWVLIKFQTDIERFIKSFGLQARSEIGEYMYAMGDSKAENEAEFKLCGVNTRSVNLISLDSLTSELQYLKNVFIYN